MNQPRTLLIAAVCTVTGAGGALGATALSSAAKNGHHHQQRQQHALRQHAAQRVRGTLRRAVHADVVVAQQGGTFGDVTYDRGTVKSVSGQDLTMTDGTPKAAYKDVTITLPADARVRRAGTPHATLADLQPGDRVAVVQAPKRTLVIAAPARPATSTR